MITEQVCTDNMHPLYWGKETHLKYEALLSDFKEKFGHDAEVSKMRCKNYEYHLNVMCAFLKKLKGDKLSVLEIGSYTGQSTRIFSEYFKSVESVDPFGKSNELSDIDDSEETNPSEMDSLDIRVKFEKAHEVIKFIFTNNVVDIVDNVIHHDMTSDDFFLKYSDEFLKESDQKKFDFIYIDGDHRYSQQKRDYTNALKFLAIDGIVGGHDFSWESTQKVIKDLGFQHKPLIHFMDDSFLIIPEKLL